MLYHDKTVSKKGGNGLLAYNSVKIFPDERETGDFSLILHFTRPANFNSLHKPTHTVQSTHKYFKVSQSKWLRLPPNQTRVKHKSLALL